MIDDGFGDGGIEHGDGDAFAALFLCGVYAEPVQQTGAEAWSEPAGPWFDGVFRNPDDVVLRGGDVVKFVFQSGERGVVENDIDGMQCLKGAARADAQFRKSFQNGEILLVILRDERRLAGGDFRGVEMLLLGWAEPVRRRVVVDMRDMEPSGGAARFHFLRLGFGMPGL